LREESSGILAWAVRGCLEWQQKGLQPPAAVIRATAEYQTESDRLGEFVGECCELEAEASCAATPLYLAYQQWENAQQIPANRRLSGTEFGRRIKKLLRQRPEDGHTREGNRYLGIRLKTADKGQS
jgi:putative DNA primase/helicase